MTRSTMVYGVDKPAPGVLSGVPTGTVLTNSDDTTQPLYITQPTTFRRMRFLRRVVPQSRGIRFEECEFVGGPSAHTSDHGLLQVTADVFVGATREEDVQVVDCTFRPRVPGIRVNGFLGWHTRFQRTDFARGVDAMGVHGGTWWNANGRPTHYPIGVSALGCTWHDFYFDAAAYQDDGWLHNDGVQIQGGDDGEVIGCWGIARRDSDIGHQGDVVGTGANASYVGGRTLSNVLLVNNVGTPDGWTIDRNWFDGGHLSVQIDSDVTSLRVTDNRFDGTASGRDVNSDATATSRPGVVVTGNVRTDGGAVNVRRG